MLDDSALPWLFATAGGVVILGAFIAYGIIATRTRTRNERERRLRDEGTRKVYREE
jgi:hypothetical protein